MTAKKNADFMTDMACFAKKEMDTIDRLDSNTRVCFRDTQEFNGYFYNDIFKEHPDIKSRAIMLLEDKTERKFDLIFTTDGIVTVLKDKIKNLTPYSEVEFKSDSIVLYRNEWFQNREYKVTSFDINSFCALIKSLGKRFVKNLDAKTEYIEGVVSLKILNEWFRGQEGAMEKGVTRMYVRPSGNILKQMGCVFEDELDPDKNILQCLL